LRQFCGRLLLLLLQGLSLFSGGDELQGKEFPKVNKIATLALCLLIWGCQPFPDNAPVTGSSPLGGSTASSAQASPSPMPAVSSGGRTLELPLTVRLGMATITWSNTDG
jgi:hypothetical protein